jgi:predicted TIM-barrel fold metal-dependent hydrolase
MFGSDWPVCTLSASYKQWVNALQSITESAGVENENKLFHDNAILIYRLNNTGALNPEPGRKITQSASHPSR